MRLEQDISQLVLLIFILSCILWTNKLFLFYNSVEIVLCIPSDYFMHFPPPFCSDLGEILLAAPLNCVKAMNLLVAGWIRKRKCDIITSSKLHSLTNQRYELCLSLQHFRMVNWRWSEAASFVPLTWFWHILWDFMKTVLNVHFIM